MELGILFIFLCLLTNLFLLIKLSQIENKIDKLPQVTEKEMNND
jgi:uncharacterized protein YneF (UPF0154 family)